MMQELERLRHVVECQVFELCGPFEEHGSVCYYVPLQYWSPVHGSLEEDYPETEAGIEAMEYFAEKANDKVYLRLIKCYRKYPWLRKFLAKQLLKTEREALYQCIYQEIKEASETYSSRVYDIEAQNSIADMRRGAEQYLVEQGYQGCYPEFQKGNRKVHVAEEHPFTILEWKHYKFRIRFMISECRKEKENQLNSGFFKGIGRKGWIEDYDYKY